MPKHKNLKQTHALRRAHRTRARITGTTTCPRLSVKRSLKHIYAQLIDDTLGKTIVASSDKDVDIKAKPIEVAKEVGKKLAEKAAAKGVKQAVFDRGAYRYHGRVAAIAEGARENGLKI